MKHFHSSYPILFVVCLVLMVYWYSAPSAYGAVTMKQGDKTTVRTPHTPDTPQKPTSPDSPQEATVIFSNENGRTMHIMHPRSNESEDQTMIMKPHIYPEVYWQQNGLRPPLPPRPPYAPGMYPPPHGSTPSIPGTPAGAIPPKTVPSPHTPLPPVAPLYPQ